MTLAVIPAALAAGAALVWAVNRRRARRRHEALIVVQDVVRVVDFNHPAIAHLTTTHEVWHICDTTARPIVTVMGGELAADTITELIARHGITATPDDLRGITR